jgi:hypothetical protein
VVLLQLCLRYGVIADGNGDVLPHMMDEKARAQETNSRFYRIILLIIIFAVGTACSVYTGIKCIVFDFESDRVTGSDSPGWVCH